MGEVVYELPIRSQWCFDVQWCPRNPSVFSAATFDGWINVYSVMGGNLEAQQRTQADKISSSFNNLDPFGTGQSLPPLQVPEQVTQTTLIPPLKKPPKWIRRPVGVSFAVSEWSILNWKCNRCVVLWHNPFLSLEKPVASWFNACLRCIVVSHEVNFVYSLHSDIFPTRKSPVAENGRL